MSLEEPAALADGAAFAGSGLARLYPSIEVPNLSLVGTFADGVDRAGLPETRSGAWRLTSGDGLQPIVPVEVDRLRQVADLPTILGGLLAALATVAVGHAVVLAIRRRRPELAVLRTLGFERRDVRAAISYQALILAGLGLLVGVPTGIAVGRVVWQVVADSVGVTTAISVSGFALVFVAIGVLLVAVLIGTLAARTAIRLSPAAVLSAE